MIPLNLTLKFFIFISAKVKNAAILCQSNDSPAFPSCTVGHSYIRLRDKTAPIENRKFWTKKPEHLIKRK